MLSVTQSGEKFSMQFDRPEPSAGLGRASFAGNPDQAIFRYNNASHYGRAVKDYAAVLAADHGAFAGFYR
jgi:hypothetical protein